MASTTPRQNVTALTVGPDGAFPNNALLPVLVYRGALDLPQDDPAAWIEGVFRTNGWFNGWRDGVYSRHHYHSTAHEVLGCYSGSARVQLGGPNGSVVEIGVGDVLVLPAGVSHKRIDSTRDFAVVGCYAGGRSYDMNAGEAGDATAANRNIYAVPMPEADPVYGVSGPLRVHWPEDR